MVSVLLYHCVLYVAPVSLCVVGSMLVLRAVFSMLVRNASPRGHMCFRCRMFSLSRACELFFHFSFIASPELW